MADNNNLSPSWRKARIKLGLVRFNAFMNRNTGWLIAFAIVFFGVANFGFQHDNRTLLEGISNVQKTQDQTLQAIKNVTIDTRLTAAQQTKIIICMLQVPIAERTPDTEKACRKQTAANSPTGSGSMATPDSASSSATPSSSTTPAESNTTTPTQTTPNCQVDVLFIHLGKCQ